MSNPAVIENPSPTERTIPGYEFGSSASAVSPVPHEELLLLEQTVGWTSQEEALLRKHANLFKEKAELMVDSWREVIAAQPHLSQWFFGPDGRPDDEYKTLVRRRFVQWVVDVATRSHDQEWLNYQEEIGLRHTPAKKNMTDARHTPTVVPLRYLLGFVPVVTDISKFLSALSDFEEAQAVQRAWEKAVHLHIVLWSRPFTKDGLW